MLNKFAVVPEHFILATTEFKPQTHLLEEADLDATLACLRAYDDTKHSSTQELGNERDETRNDGGLFAFFNCGDHSGASQPHRHIQLLPVARMMDGLPQDSNWTVLADSLTSRSAPFATFAEKLSSDMPASEVHAAYIRLYRQACRAVAAASSRDTLTDDEILGEGETRISYNMAMTRNTLVICPRIAEGAKIFSEDGTNIGMVSLNGTVLAGTALVKNVGEWEALKKDPALLSQVLARIGLPVVV